MSNTSCCVQSLKLCGINIKGYWNDSAFFFLYTKFYTFFSSISHVINLSYINNTWVMVGAWHVWQWHMVTVHPVVEPLVVPGIIFDCVLSFGVNFLICSWDLFWERFLKALSVSCICKCSVALKWSVQGILQPKWVVNLTSFGTLNPDLNTYCQHPVPSSWGFSCY